MPPIEEGAPRQEPAASQPSEPNGDEDWKAKYEALLGHSRDWEKKAKANKEAAEKIAQLEKRIGEKERAEERARLVAKVAAEKGVPAELIAGDDEESMSAWADKLKAAMTPKPAAKVEKPGSFDRGGAGGDDPMRDVVKQLFGNK